jgi:hypothetical protein
MVSRFLGMGLYSRGNGVDNPIDRTTTTPPQNGFYDCRSECRSRLGHLTKFLPFEVVLGGREGLGRCALHPRGETRWGTAPPPRTASTAAVARDSCGWSSLKQ